MATKANKSRPPILQQGNNKLGVGVWSFSLPIEKSCKSATSLCSKACYAKAGHFVWRSVRKSREEAWKSAKRKDFAARVTAFVERRKIKVVRIHVEGDWANPLYTLKWAAIAAALPGVTFYAYTRRWRDAAMLAPLEVFASLPNTHLWFSADAETGEPPRPKWSAGVAYMSLSDEDMPAFPVDLVFRDSNKTEMRKTPDGYKVCPTDDGVARKNKVTCAACKFCYKDGRDKVPGLRTPLPVL
jgi:hypothetical protein